MVLAGDATLLPIIIQLTNGSYGGALARMSHDLLDADHSVALLALVVFVGEVCHCEKRWRGWVVLWL